MPKPKLGQGRTRRMVKFKLAEISPVDRPAQTPAVAAIIKSEGDGVDKREMVDVLTSSEEGHQHGISIAHDEYGLHLYVSYAAGPDGEGHDHQLARMPDGTYTISENVGHTHTVDQSMIASALLAAVMKADADATRDDYPLTLDGVPIQDFPEVVKAAEHDHTEQEPPMSADLKKANEALAAENATLLKVVNLNPTHRAHYDTLSPSAQAEFLDLSVTGRDDVIEKALAADAVIWTADDGTEYRKSDDPRLVKVMQERDQERREMALIKAQLADERLTKRAEELSSFPGDVAVRKAILEAVDGIADEDVRKRALEALKAQSDNLSPAFQTKGQTPLVTKNLATAKEAADEMDELAKADQAENGGSYADAYDRVAKKNPELRKRAIG